MGHGKQMINGVALATAMAGLLAATVPSVAAASPATIKCEHSNACKGQSACATARNGCQGQNSCKGQGYTLQKSKADCEAAQAAVKSKPGGK
ncbi:hypothetical protein Fraau_0135 [Frateuria aurantia DSM 6220]|uniref:Silver efflux pump n=2 Tax=Frateuria aurantia TaxID=81475 RepID=H8L0K8_FRAAD|nr:hypothetical protein Fraau_0135 [Frateuria aurantia DSM 6220]